MSPLLDNLLFIAVAGVVAVPAAFFVNLGFAWRQWREGRGTRLRLFGVCVAVAVLQTVPLALMLIIYRSDESIEQQILPAVVLVAWNWLLLAFAIGRPVRQSHSRDELPLVDDEQFERRLSELATRMGVPTPVVRMVRSLSDEQHAAAFAGGLTAPSLVVTDGILHRLAPDERDAVIGHELAHLANGSLWWLTCVTPAAAAGGLLVGGVAGGWFGLLFGLALRVGLLRIVSRHFERDCDRRAADVLGYGTMASALRKIHAAHLLSDSGWKSVLIYATATHPSCAERLASLDHSASAVGQPRSSLPATSRVRAARIAAFIWFVVMAGSLAGRCARPESVWPVVPLIGVLTVPFWPLIDVWRHVIRVRRRMRQGGRRRTVGLGLAVAAVAAFFLPGEILPAPSAAFFVWNLFTAICAVSGLLLLALASPFGSHRVRRELLTSLQNHEFAEAVRIGEENASVVERVPELAHNIAVARVLSGDRAPGLADLAALVKRHPRFVQPLLTLSSFHYDAGDFGAACQFARQAAERLKKDPEPLIREAAALWRLNRLDAAEWAARAALSLEGSSGEPHAVLAGVQLERGDERGARESLETAERLSPGLPFTRVVEAEMALRFGELTEAQRALEQARAIARANPFAVIDGDVHRLESRLLAASAAGTC